MLDQLRTVASRLPKPVKSAVVDYRDRLTEMSADVSFRRRGSPSIRRRQNAPDHIVVVVIDALRSDFVNEMLTPTLSGFGTTDAVAAAPWTFPSVSSILSGRYPHEHGAVRQLGADHVADDDQMTVPPTLDDSVATLSDYLAAAGHRTFGGFAFQVPFLALSGRFHTHRRHWDASAPVVFEDYLRWVSGRERTFAYLHLGDLHEPISIPDEYTENHRVDTTIDGINRWDYLSSDDSEVAQRYRHHRRRLYRAAVDYVDDCLDSFLDDLNQTVGSDTLLVVTSDHGEAMWEHTAFDEQHFEDSRGVHGVGHGSTPYEAVTRVPICMRGHQLMDGPASLVDIAPTILQSVCQSIPDELSGQLLDNKRDSERVLLTESARYGHEKRALYSGNWKLLVSQGDNVDIGYKLPREVRMELPPDVSRRLHSSIPPWPDGGRTHVVDEGVQERLENLGYQ